MPFTDAFSIANPFAVNPQYSNTPQAAAQKQALQQQQKPTSAVPNPAAQLAYAGPESIPAARASPLMETIMPRAQQPMQAAMPMQAPFQNTPFAMANQYQPQQYQNALAQLIGQVQAAQQMQRMYPNRLVYV